MITEFGVRQAHISQVPSDASAISNLLADGQALLVKSDRAGWISKIGSCVPQVAQGRPFAPSIPNLPGQGEASLGVRNGLLVLPQVGVDEPQIP